MLPSICIATEGPASRPVLPHRVQAVPTPVKWKSQEMGWRLSNCCDYTDTDMRAWPKQHCEGGFTLIELIMVMVLLGILAVVGSNMLSDSFMSTAMVNSGNAVQSEARYAMDRLVREMREVQFIKASKKYNITEPTANPATGMVFVKNDGTTVTISLNTVNGVGLVNLGYTGAAVLVNQVTVFSLTFLDLTGTSISTLSNIPAQVAFIDVVLNVQDGKSGQMINQSMRVALRSH